jgi:hypothetical protein
MAFFALYLLFGVFVAWSCSVFLRRYFETKKAKLALRAAVYGSLILAYPLYLIAAMIQRAGGDK